MVGLPFVALGALVALKLWVSDVASALFALFVFFLSPQNSLTCSLAWSSGSIILPDV